MCCKLVSDPSRFVSRLAFQYPGDDSVKWATFQAQQDAAKRDAEITRRARALAKDKQAGVVPMADQLQLTTCISTTSSAAMRPCVLIVSWTMASTPT